MEKKFVCEVVQGSIVHAQAKQREGGQFYNCFIRVNIYMVHRKKRFTSFPGMSLTKLPLGRNYSVMTSLFPPRESLEVTSRLGTGNSRTFFLRCIPLEYIRVPAEVLYSVYCMYVSNRCKICTFRDYYEVLNKPNVFAKSVISKVVPHDVLRIFMLWRNFLS